MHVAANAEHGKLTLPHVVLNSEAQLFFSEVVQQAVNRKISHGHAQLASTLVVTHEVVLVVARENALQAESQVDFLVKLGVVKSREVVVGKVVELSEPAPGIVVLVSPLIVSEGLLEVVSVKGDRSGEEVSEILSVGFPVVL